MKKFLLLLLLLATYASAQSTSQVTTFTATGSGSGVNLLRTGVAYYQLVWHGAGTRSTCTIAVDKSVDGITYTAGGVIAGQDCTTDGAFTTTTPAYYNYIRVTITALSGSGNTVTAVVMGWINSPVGTSVSLFAGAPSGACTARQFAVNTLTGAFYDCVANVWTAVSGAGSGTVTVVGAGSLVSTAFVTGGGTTTLQTPSASSTLDSSGNASFAGTVTSTGFSSLGGSVAGIFGCANGTAPSLIANGFAIFCPTAITTGFGWSAPTGENASAGIVRVGAAASHVSAITVSALTAADLVNAVAPSTSGNVMTSNGSTWTSAPATGGGIPDITTTIVLTEEFSGGNIAVGNGGTLGELGWQSGAWASVGPVSPGVTGKTGNLIWATSSTSGVTGWSLLGNANASAGVFNSMVWTMLFGFKLNETTQFEAQFGVVDSVGSVTIANGIYFQANATASGVNWFGCTAASSTRTCTDTSVATDTSYHAFKITNDGSNNIKFYIDGTLKVTNTTNIPTSLMAFWFQETPNSNVARNLQTDYFQYQGTRQ